mgnify:FL=1
MEGLLSYEELCLEVLKKHVMVGVGSDGRRVELGFKNVNSSSIELHMGDFVLQELPPISHSVLDFRAREKLEVRRVALDKEDGFVLAPGQFILAESHEMFFLPNHLSCEYKMKSSMARIGLEHLNSGWCGAGWNGSVLTLELKNLTSHHSIRLRPGDAIGQMVFYRHAPVPSERSYAARGRYNRHNTVETIQE